MINLHPQGAVPNYIPDHVFRDPFAPWGSVPTDCPEDPTVPDIRCGHPSVDSAFDPDRHGNRADMAALSDEIHDCPVPLSDLDVFLFKSHEFGASESASKRMEIM